MYLRDMIDMLNEMIEAGEVEEYSEVTIGVQPTYPMQSVLVNIAVDDRGRPVLAASDADTYGKREWWEGL